MSYGYSQRLVEANSNADTKSLGVYLGNRCIRLGIPVSEVADTLGVSRATVYNWFWGEVNPRPEHNDKITEFLRTLRTRK
jgi:predicted transcriptional regulator